MSDGSLSHLLKTTAALAESVNSVQRKKQRIDTLPTGKPFQEAIFETLLKIPHKILDTFPASHSASQWSKVELEVRLGLIHRSGRRWQPRQLRKNAELLTQEQRKFQNLEFKAGVDEYYAQTVRQNLQKLGYEATKQPVQTVYIVQTADRSFRYEKLPLQSASSRQMVLVERKDRFETFDIAMLAHDYDLRCGVAIEDGGAPQPYDDYMDRWHMRRIKKRTNYVKPATSSTTGPVPKTWRVDYTEVTVETHDGQNLTDDSNKEFEIEVELDNAFLLRWLDLALAHRASSNGNSNSHSAPTPATQAFMQRTAFLCSELIQILDCLLPCHAEDVSFCETPLVVEEDVEVLQGRLYPAVRVLNGILRGDSPEIARQRVLNAVRGEDKSYQGRSVEFLGSMPVNLYRRSFTSKVLEDDYLLTEKSDGVRYLLYTFAPAPSLPVQAVLLNRVPKIHSFEGSDLVGRCLGPGHVLDGEIVFHRELKRSLFLIFDVLCWEERSLVAWPFRERLRLIQETIMPRYRQLLRTQLPVYMDRYRQQQDQAAAAAAATATEGAEAPSVAFILPPPRPLLILEKEFFEKREITRLLDRNRAATSTPAGTGHSAAAAVNSERMYRDATTYDFLLPALPLTMREYQQQQQQLRLGQIPALPTIYVRSCHPTDGIIFQPNRSYVFSRDYSLLKWKWADLRSIDLALTVNERERITYSVTHRQLQLVCAGPQDTLVHCSQRGDSNVGLGVFDTMRLLAEVEHLHRQRHPKDWSTDQEPAQSELLAGAIAECAYDLRLGQWRYIKMRSDKTEPNYIDSVLGVFTEQAEAISEEELEFTLLSVAMKLEQDFDHHIKKMMDKLMVWQRRGRK